jgi:MFS family permease
LASSTRYWSILLTIALCGVGTSLIFTPAFAAVGHFFHRRRGAATGIAAMGGSVGGVIFPLVLQRLFQSVGFAWATRTLGLIFLVLCIISVSLVRSRLPPKAGQSMLPDPFILKDPAFALTTIGVFFTEWGLFVPIAYIASFITTAASLPQNSNSTLPYALVAGLNAGSSVGRFGPGFIADKVGRFNLMIVMLLVCIATNFALWLPAAALPTDSAAITPLSVLYVVLFGIGSGSNISLTPVCIGQLCETEDYGRYYATCFTVVAVGSLFGIPIAGALLQADQGRYVGVVIFTGGCYFLALLAFIAARYVKIGWKRAIF